jgi:MFS family permease
VTSGYLLALALMLPLSGWLVDRLGAKRVYLGCFAAFTVASMLCGLATSAAALIGFRVLQGMVGGLLVPMAQMMTAKFAGRHIARVMGIMVVPVLIGPIAGPVLAGAILQHASWRWIFFINLPVGLLAILLAMWILPRDAGEARRGGFDFIGFALLPPGLVLLRCCTAWKA